VNGTSVAGGSTVSLACGERLDHASAVDFWRRIIADRYYQGGYLRGLRYASPFLRLVQLDIYSSGLRIGPVSPLLAIFVPTWESTYDDLGKAEKRGRVIRGIRFQSVDRSTITFVPNRNLGQVLAGLLDVGVEVQP
jgi:hypothetical protein